MNTANGLRISLAAAALLAGAATQSNARAADGDSHTSVVSYADLDLTRKEGVETFRHRLTMASHDVCRRDGDGAGDSADIEACRSDAMQNALHDLRTAVAAASRSNRVVASAAPN